MGIVYAKSDVIGPEGEKKDIEFLVDSGASYSLLPGEIWKALGLKEQRRMDFNLADGTTINMPISECRFVFQGIDCHSPVVLGDEGVVPLLGAITLETMGLVLNPFTRELQPMRVMLA